MLKKCLKDCVLKIKRYICKVNKAQTKKTNDMKIQAKDLKVGMTVKNGYWSMLINTIKLSNLKNGTPTVIISGIVTNKQKNIYGKCVAPYEGETLYKHLTFVNAN